MIHYGDITKISGYEVPIVDIVCGGSPCQDLSIAGLRKGLQGERSGLFMEQIRIVKEMREHDKQQKQRNGTDVDLRCLSPRYMVWENVPGALSSNNGRDFQAVLTEIIRICEPNADDVPLYGGGGRQAWTPSGAIFGISNGVPFSVAYRVHDAQFWGVPQRRKRIALVADFNGLSASEILFERKGLSGDFKEIPKKEKANPRTNEKCIAFSSNTYGGWQIDEISQTIRASGGDYGGGSETLILQNNRLRRKTPLETERLFGYPDGWTDIGDWKDSKGKKHKGDADAPRYKALGNSIAIPFWEWMADRMIKQLGKEKSTMASLFDGIGGFPLSYSRAGCKPVWASEIEEFPIAVTKNRFQ